MSVEERVLLEANVASGLRDALRSAALLSDDPMALVEEVLAEEGEELTADAVASLQSEGLL